MQITIYPNSLYDADPEGTLRTSTPNNDPQSGVPGKYPEITPNVTTIGSTTYSPVWPTMASIYSDGGKASSEGAPNLFNLADLSTMGQKPIQVLDKVSVDSSSSAIFPGCRGCQIVAFFSDPANTCDITLYVVIASVDYPMKKWTGVTYKDTEGLYCGHADAIDLQGYPLIVEVQNITHGHVTIGITPMA